MKKLFPITISFALVCTSAQAGDISDAFVEKTLGISGVKHTTKTQSKYGMTFSDVEYKDAKGQSLITVRHGSIDQYNMWKQTAGPDAIPVSGLGTDAFRYKTLKAVCSKSESTAVCVTPDFLTKTPTITDAHLQALVNAAL